MRTESEAIAPENYGIANSAAIEDAPREKHAADDDQQRGGAEEVTRGADRNFFHLSAQPKNAQAPPAPASWIEPLSGGAESPGRRSSQVCYGYD